MTPSTICPCCGRRHRARRARPFAETPLLDWEPPPPPPPPRRTTGAKLILCHDLRDADGAPRACLAIPGRRLLLAFQSIPAALAALAHMEAAYAGR